MKIVGIGASAGGVEAMRAFFERLPDDTGAAFVVIQHLSPDFKSMMDELLAGHTNMPVTVVRQTTTMEPNHLYLMPGDKNMRIQNGLLVLEERRDPEKLNLPIDRFFHSLGLGLGEEAVAVVLSGSGSDGSRGVRTIKEKGGLILVQDPASAKFDGMPVSSIQSQMADSVQEPGELAEELARLLRNTESRQLSELSQVREEAPLLFDRTVDLASNRSGINFREYRKTTLVRRIEKRMLLRNCLELEAYYQLLREEQEEADTLCKEFLIGVTRFFRDPETFDFLRDEVLPRLFQQREAPEKTLRIWVPGCSTGEEAYSIALLAHQYARENSLPANYKVFATDVDKEAIDVGGLGVYPPGIAADIPEKLLSTYFNRTSQGFQMIDEVRDRVLFAVQDVLRDPPFINMDLVSCRNLLIYLKDTAKQRVLSTFHFALNHDGMLLLGPSESLGPLKNAFQEFNRPLNLYTCRKEVSVPPPDRSHNNDRFPMPGTAGAKQHTTSQPAANDDQHQWMRDDFQDPFSRYLIENYGPDCLFLNRELDVLYLRGRPERILQFPKAVARLNLRKMLNRRHLLLFREGVRQALATGAFQRYEQVVFETGSGPLAAQLFFRPVQLPSIEAPLVLVEIEISGTTEAGEPQRKKTSRLEQGQIEILEKELGAAENRADKLVSELEATNEELQASNRELLATNEELQSTNEELQSVNEELYTVNSELQAKNEALLTANNDINNLLRSTEIGTIFLDKELHIRRFTPAIHQQFHLLKTDIGRPITDFSSAFPDLDLGAIARQVFDSLERHEEEITDKDGNHYFLRIFPYRTGKNRIKGLVITFIDINELIKARENLLETARRFQAMFDHSRDIILILDQTLHVKQVNRPFGPYALREIADHSLLDLVPDDQRRSLKELLDEALQEQRPRHASLSFPNNATQEYRYLAEIIPAVTHKHKRTSDSGALLILKEAQPMEK